VWLWLNTALTVGYQPYEETEGPVMIVNGINWKFEGLSCNRHLNNLN